MFRNAVRTSKGAYTSEKSKGESLSQASMVHLRQEEKPQKVAWSVQPQLQFAVDHVSKVAQGVKQSDQLVLTLLYEHRSVHRMNTGVFTGVLFQVSQTK